MAETFQVGLKTVPAPLKSGRKCGIQFVVSSSVDGTREVFFKVAVPCADDPAGGGCALIGPNDIPVLTCDGETIPISASKGQKRIWSSSQGYALEKGEALTLAFNDLTVATRPGIASVTVSLNGKDNW